MVLVEFRVLVDRCKEKEEEEMQKIVVVLC